MPLRPASIPAAFHAVADFRELGVRYVVVGTYELRGAKTGAKIEAHVLETATGSEVGRASASGSLADVRDLSLSVGRALRDRLRLRVASPSDQDAALTTLLTNPEAEHLYDEGLLRLRAFDALGARSLFERAGEDEPSAPGPQGALARALDDLGYTALAVEAAQRALDRSGSLPRDQRLSNEAKLYELSGEWAKAAEIDRALCTFFPDEPEYALRLARALKEGGKPLEAHEVLEKQRALSPPLDIAARIDMADAEIAHDTGDEARANELARAAGAKGDALGAPLLVADARFVEARCVRTNGADQAAVIRLATEAQSGFLAAGNRERAAAAEDLRAEAVADQGDLPTAQRLLEEVAATSRETGQVSSLGRALGDLVVVKKRREDYEGALAVDLESRALTLTPRVHAVELHNVAEILRAQANLAEAKKTADDALALRRKVGDKRGEASSLLTLVDVAIERRETDEAAAWLKLAKEDEKADAKTRNVAVVDGALLALALGVPDDTLLSSLREACDALHPSRLMDEARCRGVLGRALLAAGRPNDAIAALDVEEPRADAGGDKHAARLFAIDDAYVRGIVGPEGARRVAIARLEEALSEAHAVGAALDVLCARLSLALVEIAGGRAPREPLSTIAREATAGGFVGVAAEAKARKR